MAQNVSVIQEAPLVNFDFYIIFIFDELVPLISFQTLRLDFFIKGILCEVPFFGGSVLLLSYSVGAMAPYNYIPQIILYNVL